MIRGVAALAVVACGVTPPADPAPSAACREALTCRVLCDSPPRRPCACPAPAIDQAAAQHAIDCTVDCNQELGACLAGPCAALSVPCYFAGGPGDASCARTWQCFGDCGDDGGCLDGCAAAASPQARPRFREVEVCSDRYVATDCSAPGPGCDLEALTGPCAAAFRACLDDGRAPETPALRAACECGPDPAGCVDAARDALAACPTADVAALTARVACLAEGCADCPPWAPSDLCREVLGTRGPLLEREANPGGA